MFSATATAAIILRERPALYNPQTKSVTIGVTATYASFPSANLEFNENGTHLGFVYAPLTCPIPESRTMCDMTLMVQNYPLGAHTITASYPGDDRGNAPATLTFTIYVTDYGWLPAVIGLLSD